MCDCDLPEFFDTNIVKARKPHQCFECRKAILIGESYWLSSGKWNGYFEMFHTCIECEVLRSRLASEANCCVAYGEIYEMLMDNRHGWGPDGREFWRKHRRFQEQQRVENYPSAYDIITGSGI